MEKSKPGRPVNNIYAHTFGSWTVVGEAMPTRSGEMQWRCQCVCGTQRVVLGKNLVSGKSRSCGCQPRKPRKVKEIVTNEIATGKPELVAPVEMTIEDTIQILTDQLAQAKAKARALARVKAAPPRIEVTIWECADAAGGVYGYAECVAPSGDTLHTDLMSRGKAGPHEINAHHRQMLRVLHRHGDIAERGTLAFPTWAKRSNVTVVMVHAGERGAILAEYLAKGYALPVMPEDSVWGG